MIKVKTHHSEIKMSNIKYNCRQNIIKISKIQLLLTAYNHVRLLISRNVKELA